MTTDARDAVGPEAIREANGAPSRRGILVRVGSAALLLVVLVGALALGELATSLMLAALVGVGVSEFYLITRRSGVAAAPWILFPVTALFLFRFQLNGISPLLVPLGITAAIVVGLSVFLFSPRPLDGMSRWAIAMAGSLYIGWMLGFYLALYLQHKPDPDRVGFAWVAALAGSAMIGDTTAMLVGTRWGRHRFFPLISPKKSVEGAIAGFVAQTAVFAVFSTLADVPAPHNIILGALVAIAAQAGDLIESQFKRSAGVKDASTFVPGHGGMLDRMDSLIMLPGVAYYYMTLLHLADFPR